MTRTGERKLPCAAGQINRVQVESKCLSHLGIDTAEWKFTGSAAIEG